MNLLQISPRTEGMKTLTEVTLALLLFADAATLDLRQVRGDPALIARLLGIGMPLTMLFGAACFLGLFPWEGLAYAAMMGANMAPTDAPNGLPIFNDPKMPVRIRRALNVESGLNDGIAAPFVMLFIAFAVAGEAHSHGNWLSSALLEVAVALLVGAVVGIAGGWFLTKAVDHGWTAGTSEQVAVLGLALTAYFGSLMVHGNGFIAAFSGGIIFSAATRNRFGEPTEFTENTGTVLSLVIWTIFGAIADAEGESSIPATGGPITYAVLSLTAIRMIPVALAMRETGLRSDTVALMGLVRAEGPCIRGLHPARLHDFQGCGQADRSARRRGNLDHPAQRAVPRRIRQPLSFWYSRRLAKATARFPNLMERPELRERPSILRGRHPK
jgi:NhaP-type Na+/H+ or K+/H+ antiporter